MGDQERAIFIERMQQIAGANVGPALPGHLVAGVEIEAVGRCPEAVQIQFLHHDDVVEVLFRDKRDRNVIDVHLILLDEVDQQIERPLELGDLDGVGVR